MTDLVADDDVGQDERAELHRVVRQAQDVYKLVRVGDLCVEKMGKASVRMVVRVCCIQAPHTHQTRTEADSPNPISYLVGHEHEGEPVVAV